MVVGNRAWGHIDCLNMEILPMLKGEFVCKLDEMYNCQRFESCCLVFKPNSTSCTCYLTVSIVLYPE